MKYFVICFIDMCFLCVIFILLWDKASSPVLEREAFPKGLEAFPKGSEAFPEGLGRYITPVTSQAEVRRGSWSQEEMLLLDTWW